MDNLQLAIDPGWGIVETVSEKKKTYGYRFYPDKVKGEGFFIAAFTNRQEAIGNARRPMDGQIKKRKIEKLSAKETGILKPYLKNAEDFFFIKQNEEVIAIPTHLENDLGIIQSSLYIKKAGVKLGTLIRDELIPAHELAVSTIIGPSIPRFGVDKETALQYLRREEIKIEPGLKGWLLLTHQDSAGCSALPIGWVKVISNRINNYYPAAWRILNK